MLSKAGVKTGDFKTSETSANKQTPIVNTIVVTIEETAIAIVEITSPSSLPGFTSAFSIAVNALGALRLVTLPVTKLKYVPPTPSIGV